MENSQSKKGPLRPGLLWLCNQPEKAFSLGDDPKHKPGFWAYHTNRRIDLRLLNSGFGLINNRQHIV